jgi:beta-lactamase class A
MSISRRDVALGLSAAILAGPAAATENDALAELERRSGGRLGVFALDTGSGASIGHRADERFLMCSTFKALMVADVLKRVDAGRERLDRRVAYGENDVLGWSPVTRAHVKEGALPVEALCAAAVEQSDNGAANLLLRSIGGPAEVTRFARGLGDKVTRLDRWELELNNPSGDLDTTSPRAMAGSLRAVLLGRVLSPASKARLQDWMVASTPGLKRLRAGMPSGWRVGDKSGTGDAQTNDNAIAIPPGRAPLIVSAYYAAPQGGSPAAETTLKQVGAIVAEWALKR